MSKPNRTAAKFRERFGRDPKAVAATEARLASDPMMQDIAAFQRGDMSAEEFRDKYAA